MPLVHQLHALDARDASLSADPAFAQRLAANLGLIGSTAHPVASPMPARPAPPLVNRLSRSASPRLNRSRRWLPIMELAAAVILLLALIDGFVTNGRFLPNLGRATETPTLATGAAANVPMLGGSPARTGEQPGPGPGTQPGTLWHDTYTDSGVASSPAVVDGTLFASTYSGIIAVDALTGQHKWHYITVGSGLSSPAVANGIVYFGYPGPPPSSDGFTYVGPSPNIPAGLVALNAASGKLLWDAAIGDASFSSPVIANGLVLTAADKAGKVSLFAIDARTGKQRWHFALDTAAPQCQCAPYSAAVANGLVYIGNGGGMLYALDLVTGQERWHAATGGGLVSTPSIAGGEVFVGAFQHGGTQPVLLNPDLQPILYRAFDAKTGQQRWALTVAMQGAAFLPPSVTVADGAAYFVVSDAKSSGIRAVDAATGKTRWSKSDLDEALLMPPVIADGVLYTSAFDGSILAVDAGSGRLLWRVTADASLGGLGPSLAVANGSVYFGTWAGVLYALGSTATGVGTPVAAPATSGQLLPNEPCPLPVGRTSSDQAIPGTPSAGLVNEPPFSGWRLMQLPSGGRPSQTALSGIIVMLQQLTNCAETGGHDRARAFYSNDYLRRFHGVPPADGFWYGISGFRVLPAVQVLLPDGRIGILANLPGGKHLFMIFVEQDSRWLIDEIDQVVPGAVPPPVATPGREPG